VNREQLEVQRTVLLTAAKASPLGLYAGPLRNQANEIERVLRAANEAEQEGIEHMEFVVAGALSQGVEIFWPNLGTGRILRLSRVAGDVSGIYVEWAALAPDWVNVQGSSSPVLVVIP
jgi:hypothetical protein